MLSELVVWAGVKSFPAARRLGYAKAAVSLWSRRRRCAALWREHEANTRQFVLDVAQLSRRFDTIWLFGAGTVADLPLGELSTLFHRVMIFDVALLAGARRQAAHFSNVELRLADVTGVVEPLTEWRPQLPLPLPSDDILSELDPVPPDCVISVNLLSQLPLLPMEYVRRHGISRTAAETFGRAILKAHLRGLGNLGCPIGLIADASRIWRSRTGEVVMQESAVLDVALPPADREWFWTLAPRGEIDPEAALEVRVQASRPLAMTEATSSLPEWSR